MDYYIINTDIVSNIYDYILLYWTSVAQNKIILIYIILKSFI